MAHILLFSKPRDCVEAKTRLRSDFSDQQISLLHQAFVTDCLDMLTELCASKVSCFWYQNSDEVAQRLYPQFQHQVQCGGSFGDRLEDARRKAFASAEFPLIVIGSDCPLLSLTLLQQATKEATAGKIVLGPSQNGGFYLLGIPRAASHVKVNSLFAAGNEVVTVRKAYGAQEL
ncbi:MAG: DUF2064 domain-containing protein, partial [Bdellovibrionales bacterium]|nr:DUF2064 domain-containing protein [Bdellovibrionales bacterium]